MVGFTKEGEAEVGAYAAMACSIMGHEEEQIAKVFVDYFNNIFTANPAANLQIVEGGE